MELFSHLFLVEQQVRRSPPLVTDRRAGCLTDVLVVVGEPAVCHVTWSLLSASTVADVVA